jgi:hypothetical protein
MKRFVRISVFLVTVVALETLSARADQAQGASPPAHAAGASPTRTAAPFTLKDYGPPTERPKDIMQHLRRLIEAVVALATVAFAFLAKYKLLLPALLLIYALNSVRRACKSVPFRPR